MKLIRTKGCGLDDAAVCRRNGWKVGDRLSGVEAEVMSCITITAIGRTHVLAIWDGEHAEETLTALEYRNWKKMRR